MVKLESSPITGVSSEVENEVTVYPNPGSGLYTLNVAGIEGPATLTVTDVRGRVVHTATLNTTTNRSTHHLDLSHCASGIYTVTIGTHAVQHTIKVGKE